MATPVSASSPQLGVVHELTPELRGRIEAHLANHSQRLAATTACGAARRCKYSSGWQIQENAWRRQVLHAERMRLLTYALDTGEFMPDVRRPIFRRRQMVDDSKAMTFNTQPLAAFAPEYSCASSAWRVAASGDGAVRREFTSRIRVGGDDGHKDLCGRQIAKPCTVLSVGSNFQDGFERAMSTAVGCRSYIVDPTLGAEQSAPVVAFAKRVGSYGATLNASVGLGRAGSNLRVEPQVQRPLVPLRSLLKDAASLGCNGARCHLSVMKLDCEGCEFEALTHPTWGAWALCDSGYLTIDELVVEVHAAKMAVSLSSLHAVFAGAVACGLMLHQKEVNWDGCHKGNCGASVPTSFHAVVLQWVSMAVR